MNEKIKLSVIVPVYNTQKYLKRCIDSILYQSYSNLEIIIVNDASTDNSDSIIQEYCCMDARVRCVSHSENKGLFYARVTGVSYATGDYVAFVDSDDYISVNYYADLIEYASENECDIVAGNTVRKIDDNIYYQYTFHKICFGSKKLIANEVRDRFFSQEGCCYAWHTVWNKIYKKALWDECFPEFKKITKHLVMTEDIAFSSVLLYNAKSFGYINKDTSYYYYCENLDASTNTQNYKFDKFKKNINDIIQVFRFVGDYLLQVNAEDTIIKHFYNFRKRYVYLYSNSIDKWQDHREEALSLISELNKGIENISFELSSFETLQSRWFSETEEIKKRISNKDIKVVSFDIFDTLLLRPLWNPEDVFHLMQKEFEHICPKYRNLEFAKIRQAAEIKARNEISNKISHAEDVNLDEIYDEIQVNIQISDIEKKKLQILEEQIETNISTLRKTAKSLYDYALSCNKKVILVSDMYLKSDTINAMLHKNGYTGYDKLFLSSSERVCKFSGKLYDRVLNELKILPNEILHIGDNWNSDIICAKEKGIQTAHLPKTKDRFCNKIAGAPTNNLSALGCLAGGIFTEANKMYSSIGYRAMAALSANKFFDNPYASWLDGSDLDANPYIIGYYPVGTHLLAITKWLVENARKKNIQNIVFLSRDGYLPKLSFDMLKHYFNVSDITTSYVPCSRMALMPWIIENENGLFNLPVDYLSHSPRSIIALLEKYISNYSDDTISELLTNAGFILDSLFKSETDYLRFISWLKDNLFSLEKLEEEKSIVRKFYRSQIPEGSLVFDLGYSGRILSAIRKAVQYNVTFAYVHEDSHSFETYCRRDSLDVIVMYSCIPAYSDLIREFFLSEPENSCVGFQIKGEEIVPKYENYISCYSERYTFDKIKDGVCDFLADFIENFYQFKELLYFNNVRISMIFEGMIHSSLDIDRNALILSCSEDVVYGHDDRISMADFWKEQKNIVDISTKRMIDKNLQGKSCIIKALFYFVYDRNYFKDKVKSKFSAYPSIVALLKIIYKMLKYIKNKF